MKPRTFAYCRVSSDEQFNSGLSIDEQRRQCIEFARKNDLDLGRNDCRIGEEAASAYHLPFGDRPLGRELNTNLQKGDHIIIAKVDRAFRDMLDCFKNWQLWQDRGVIVHMLDLPVSGQPIFDRLILGILAWCAEFESHRKSERMLDVYRSARRQLRPLVNFAPICFLWKNRQTRELVYDPVQREHCRWAFEMYMGQGMSLPQITSWFMHQKIKPVDRRRSPKQTVKWNRKSKLSQAADFDHRILSLMINIEAEMRYYESRGFEGEKAAYEWLRHWCDGTLPTREELEAAVASGAEAFNRKGQL